MVQVVWTQRALRELSEIVAYVSQFNPLAAQRLAVRLRQAADGLKTFPDRGRFISDNRRDLVLIRPYIIRYRVTRKAIIVLRIRHGAPRPG